MVWQTGNTLHPLQMRKLSPEGLRVTNEVIFHICQGSACRTFAFKRVCLHSYNNYILITRVQGR